MPTTLLRIAIGVLLLVLGITLFRHVVANGQHDFMAFYLGGKVAASGQIAQIYYPEPYQPYIDELRAAGERMSPYGAHYFIRPAVQAFFYVPFSMLTYPHAAILMLTMNFLALGILVWKLPGWIGVPQPDGMIARLALTVFFPFVWSISVGQDTLFLTCVIACGYALLRRGRDGWAGLLLGVCAWKPHLVWLMPVVLVTARRWLGAAICLITSCCLLAVSFLLVGVSGVRQWLLLVQARSSDIMPYVMGNLRGLGIHAGAVCVAIAVLIVVSGLFLALRYGTLPEKLSAGLLAALLVSPHTYWQDYSLAAIVGLANTNRWMSIAWLLPWPYFYSRTDELPYIVLALVTLAQIGLRYIPPVPEVERRSIAESVEQA